MFEQTFLADQEPSRKPYSMVLSLLLQVSVIGALCLTPFIFTQGLPALHLASLVNAPRKASAPKASASAMRSPVSSPRAFRFNVFQLRNLQSLTISHNVATAEPAPAIDGAGNPNGMSDGPAGILDSMVGNAPPPPIIKPKPKQQAPIRVGTIAAANLIHMVQPAYPPLAKATRVSGTVEFTAVISKAGTIENLQLLRGHPLLVDAARNAVLQWRYRPTLLNGEPVEIITDITVNFTLNQ